MSTATAPSVSQTAPQISRTDAMKSQIRKFIAGAVFKTLLVVGLPVGGVVLAVYFALPLMFALAIGFLSLAGIGMFLRAICFFVDRALQIAVTIRAVSTLTVVLLLFSTNMAGWIVLMTFCMAYLMVDNMLGNIALKCMQEEYETRRHS